MCEFKIIRLLATTLIICYLIRATLPECNDVCGCLQVRPRVLISIPAAIAFADVNNNNIENPVSTESVSWDWLGGWHHSVAIQDQPRIQPDWGSASVGHKAAARKYEDDLEDTKGRKRMKAAGCTVTTEGMDTIRLNYLKLSGFE